ncbi:TIGR02444 family protein [Thalassospira sp.]|uniref:TIGR02444 family protein n=1 Tax=Thalassospira sp. TaxID=1912094 RepID=UPI0027355190|nr:TIGR02444 family protein [Thalassospira sp.]MDP2699869.1 TIGR02444 family protein [Thalassospira sp.]
MNAQNVWNFTVSLYGREGVAPLCLDLQERCGLDVNMVLFLLCLGQQGQAPHSIAALENAVRDWREKVIVPLRATRRYLRGNPAPDIEKLRERIKQDELAAEKIEQKLLCAAVEAVPANDPFAAAHAYVSPTRFNLTQKECDHALAILCQQVIAMQGTAPMAPADAGL